MATRAASPDRVLLFFVTLSRCHAVTLSRCHAVTLSRNMYIFNRGDSHMKGPGMLIGNFELNLLRKPTWAWASLLLTPQIDKFQHNWLNKRSMSFCLKTEMGEGLFCLLCKKHDTPNPQNAQKSLKITAVRHSI